MSSSTVRRGQRPGGAALQLDVLALSTALDHSDINDGRLKASLESMMQCAVRPELEINAAKPPSTADNRMQYASRIRLALATGKTPDEFFLTSKDANTPLPSTIISSGALPVSSSSSSSSSSPTTTTTLTSTDRTQTTPVNTNPEIPFILDSSRCEMGSIGFKLLSSLLMNKACQRLVYLDLSSNSATDLGKEFIGIQTICDSLATLPRLTYLSLHNNLLLAPGCEAVSKFLLRTSSLQYLDLSRCNIGPSGSKELCRAFYSRALHQRRSSSDGTNGEVSIAHAYDDNDNDEDDDETFLDGENETVGTLDSPASSSAANPSRRLNQTLVWLDLSENNLSGYGSHDRTNTKAVKQLLSGLLHHPTIRSLDLSRNRLTRQDVLTIADSLETNPALQILTLDENSIDAFPAARIATALINNPNMKTLSLRSNRIRSDGASAFADLLRRQTTLRSLDVRNNYIGDIGQKDIQLALLNLPPPPEVSAYGNGPTTGDLNNEGKENTDDTNMNTNDNEEDEEDDDRMIPGTYRDTETNSSRPLTASTSDVMEESIGSNVWEQSVRTVTDDTTNMEDEVSSLVTNGGRKSSQPNNPTASSPVQSTKEGNSSSTNNSRPPTASIDSSSSSSSSSTYTSSRPAPEPGSLEYYAEMKENDDDDDDEDGDVVSKGTPNPVTMITTSATLSSSSSSSSIVVPNASPSRAVGSGIRALRALRQQDGTMNPSEMKDAYGETSGSTTTEETTTLNPPQLIETDDGAWIDSKGRKIFIKSDTIDQ